MPDERWHGITVVWPGARLMLLVDAHGVVCLEGAARAQGRDRPGLSFLSRKALYGPARGYGLRTNPMLPDFTMGTVRLTARGLRHQRKLTQHGGAGMKFGNGLLTAKKWLAPSSGSARTTGARPSCHRGIRARRSGRARVAAQGVALPGAWRLAPTQGGEVAAATAHRYLAISLAAV
jgi:hypothetical protein